MRRKLFTLCSAVSLLLCLAICVLWGDSYSFQRVAVWNGVTDFDFLSNHGRIRVVRRDWFIQVNGRAVRQVYNRDGQFSGETRRYDGEDAVGDGAGWPLGFGSGRGPFGDGIERRRQVTVPHWSLAVALAVAPAIAVYCRVRRGRRTPGLCSACGYDLRATPRRCPECGVAAA